MEGNTAKKIIEVLAEWSSEKRTIDPQTWLDAASKLNVLLQVEIEKLIDMKLAISKLQAVYLANGDTAAKAKVKVEAMDEWAQVQKQQALIERAKETILLAKKSATLATELMRNKLD